MRNLQTVHGQISLDDADIHYIESSGNYVKIWVGDKVHLVRGTLTSFIEALDSATFWRVHRSYVVNSTVISSIRSGRAGLGELCLSSGQLVPVSRKRKSEIFEAFRQRERGMQHSLVSNERTRCFETVQHVAESKPMQ